MKNAIAIPTTTSVAKTSEMNANHAAWPRIGRDESLSTIATAASAIVGSSTMKPQKMNACIRPGPSFCRSFFWRKTWVSSRVMRSGVGARASGRTGVRDERHARPDATHEQKDRHDDDGREGRGGYEPVRRFSISSVRAGTTLKRSPTTPRSAIFRIGASGSFVIATIRFAPFMPTRCWSAPLIPAQM